MRRSIGFQRPHAQTGVMGTPDSPTIKEMPS